MSLQILSLLFLVLAIVFGFVRKSNVGLVALGAAPLLAYIGGVKTGVVFGGFPTKLFLTLLGTMLFFAVLQDNGTLELFSKKIIALVGRKAFLIPVIIYISSYILSAVGPGAISVQAVTILFAVSLAVQMKISPVLMAGMALLGAVGGTVSPIALTGIIVKDLLAAQNITADPTRIFLGVSIANAICAAIIYVFFKGYRIRSDLQLKLSDTERFNVKQSLSLAALAALVILVVGLGQDVGLVSFVLALALIVVKAGNEKAAIKQIPWGVLLLICGVNVLMTVTKELGGITLLSNILATFMNDITAPLVIGMTGGTMSWFSSANGVVLPTLIPAVPGIVANVGGNVTLLEMVMAICAGATVAGISPLSTGGSLTLAAYTQEKHIDEKEQSKLFAQLFALSAAQVVIVSLLGLFGLYRFF